MKEKKKKMKKIPFNKIIYPKELELSKTQWVQLMSILCDVDPLFESCFLTEESCFSDFEGKEKAIIKSCEKHGLPKPDKHNYIGLYIRKYMPNEEITIDKKESVENDR